MVGSRFFRRNGIDGILGSDIIPDDFCPVGLVSENVAALNVDLLQQFNSMDGIVIPARREHERKRIA